MGPDAMILVLWMLSFKPTFSLSSFTFIKRLFSSSSLFAIRAVSSAYLRSLIFLPAILIPACASYSPVFLIMYSAAAKSLQLCPTLWDPIDSSPPGCPVPGILQARTLEWVAISFSSCSVLAIPWTALHISSMSRWQYTASMYSFSYLEPVCCSMSSSNCCFLLEDFTKRYAFKSAWKVPENKRRIFWVLYLK